ncbi:uncharacterized protein V6R79_002551 [Siganus canaliculatus]
MEVSSQDPPLMAMDLSKGYSVNPLSRSHTEAMDLAKKPEWYHRRPPGCSTDISSPFRSRASSSYSSLPAAPVHCRDMEQRPETLGNYMNSPLAARGLYHDGVHGNLWHSGFYRPDQPVGPVPESSGGEEESDSGSDVIFLVSSAKEPLLCSPFIQDGVRHIVEPLSPAVSSLEEGRGCYHLPQPLTSPSPDSSYSEDSSDSSVDIPVHHARPVVLLSDLSAVYGNLESPVDISSDDSDVIEVSVTREKKKSDRFRHKKTEQKMSEDEKAASRGVRRSTRIRKSTSETPPFGCSPSRHSLRRQAKNNAVGMYNESCDSDDIMEFVARVSSSDADESTPLPSVSPRASIRSQESGSDAQADRKSQRESQTVVKVSLKKSVAHKRKKLLALSKSPKFKRTEQKQRSRSLPKRQESSKSTKSKLVRRRRKKRRAQAGPSAQFPPREPEIQLRFIKLKDGKKDKKAGSFCPFIHMEKRTCTVVNYQEEEATMRSSGGGQQQVASRSLSGFVPTTSCFHLGRSSMDLKSEAALQCCLCGHTANAMGLGDLHGPYHPTSQDQCSRTEQLEEQHVNGLVKSQSANASDDDVKSNSQSLPKVPSRLHECWIHEDCGIWSAGVFLVRGKLYGLEEAARLAQETTCSACGQTGAIMGCFQKGCPSNYHYRCAIQSGCSLNEDNFSIRCPEHKNRQLLCASRQHKR